MIQIINLDLDLRSWQIPTIFIQTFVSPFRTYYPSCLLLVTPYKVGPGRGFPRRVLVAEIMITKWRLTILSRNQTSPDSRDIILLYGLLAITRMCIYRGISQPMAR